MNSRSSLAAACAVGALLVGGWAALPRASASRDVSQEEENSTATGVIKGVVQRNGRTLQRSRIVVEVAGLDDSFQQRVNPDGTFLFKKVPDGEYTLKAAGTFKNISCAGELKGVKPATEEKAEPVTISVE